MNQPRSAGALQRAVSELLRGDVVLLSGACGTELRRRGVPTPLPLWSTVALANSPERVREVHRDYVLAGARILTANTFRTNRAAFAAAGLPDRSRELTALAVRLARRAVDDARVRHRVLVAGSIAPVRDCYRPDLAPDDATLRLEHGLRVRDLVAARADLALVETMNSVREALAALGACRAAALPAMVSFVCATSPDNGARLLSGEPLGDAVRAVLPLGPAAILVNCCALDVAGEALDALLAATALPVGVYANGAGQPDDAHGWKFEGGVTKADYVAAARGWIAAGARLVGGCCGTSPDWIAALR